MNELGKTYVCGMCGTEVFVENEGTGTLHCCKKPMKMGKWRSKKIVRGSKDRVIYLSFNSFFVNFGILCING
jgi:desulfoferrodoxin-like iron-binding protein